MMDLEQAKIRLLEHTDVIARDLYEHPVMNQLFLELTLRCNLECAHCGSSCTHAGPMGLSKDVLQCILQQICEDDEYRDKKPYVILTGGEPMIREDFFEIAEMIHALGFKWGMTTNGTLITPEAASRMKDLGMRSIAVSIDGPREYHNRFRQSVYAYDMAMQGLQALIGLSEDVDVIVTTVVTHQSIALLPEMLALLTTMDIDRWRLLGMEPIGRAAGREDLLLTADDYRTLFSFIKMCRTQQLPVEYGCPHYLGLEYEAEVRDWCFRCLAGTQVCSVTADGFIGACLDIERNEKTVQGHVFQDRLLDVWRNRFQIFRQDLSCHTEGCQGCSAAVFCKGGAHHTYDHRSGVQRLCMRGVLFE